MNQKNNFIYPEGQSAQGKAIVEMFNQKFLPAEDYWYYAFQPIVIDTGGAGASAIHLADFFINKNWCLIVQFRDEKGHALDIYDVAVQMEGSSGETRYIYITKIPITELKVSEKKEKGFMVKLQKRNYKINLKSNNHNINIINLKTNGRPIQDEKKTEELFEDLQQVIQGKEIVKPWHLK